MTESLEQLLHQAATTLADARLLDEMRQVLRPVDRERLRQAQLQVIELRRQAERQRFTEPSFVG